MDAGGAAVVDAMVYGSQQSSSSSNGTIASPEIPGRRPGQRWLHRGGGGRPYQQKRGSFPDGADTDSNCADFLTQSATTLPMAAAEGATSIKVASVSGFDAGQTILIDTGANLESAVIATVGTAGTTTVRAGFEAGAAVIPVASGLGFSPGQTITVDSETAEVVSTGGRGGAGATITVAGPLRFAHAAGAQVSGTGITLTAALTRAHAGGTQVAAQVPTPGAPNQYSRRRR
jgi:hypothetical protein